MRELKKSVMADAPPKSQAKTPDLTRSGPVRSSCELAEMVLIATSPRLAKVEEVI